MLTATRMRKPRLRQREALRQASSMTQWPMAPIRPYCSRRDEDGGADQSALRVAPAQQGFRSRDLQAERVYFGLKVQLKLATGQGITQVVEQHGLLAQPAGPSCGHRRKSRHRRFV